MKNNVFSDAELVHQYCAGNENALGALLDRHQRRIYGFIYKNVRCEAISEDIFQETFIKIIITLRAGQYNEEGKFLSWALRIAHNLTADFFRKENKMPKKRDTENFSFFDDILSNEPSAEDFLISNQIEKDVMHLLIYLPTDQKEILELRLFENKSFKEIAIIKNISINTALGRMRYAILNMRKLIDKHQISITI